MDLVLLAVPGFFLLIGLELIAERIRGTNFYRVNDSITSLTTGVFSQLIKVVELMIPFTVYLLVYDNLALLQLPNTPWVWLLVFVLYDFCYYWLHRFGHEMNILWAAHVVHHSSEEYNLTTALRQTGTGFLSFIFYLPLALIGIDPKVLITVASLNLIYQYWVHTQHIGKLGWYEWIFVTPSNHRVHHAQNGVYIDRNYGGVFILWDRLFGSFQEELDEQPPIYGIRGALQSWNPLWANLQVYNQLFQDFKHTTNWWYKLTIWFRRTGWRPPDVVEKYPLQKTDLDDFHKFHTSIKPATKVYAILSYALNAAVTLSLILFIEHLLVRQQMALICVILFGGYTVGALMENRVNSLALEMLKNTVLILLLGFCGFPEMLILFTAFVLVFSIALFVADKSSGVLWNS